MREFAEGYFISKEEEEYASKKEGFAVETQTSE